VSSERWTRGPVPRSTWVWLALVAATYASLLAPGITWGEDSGAWLVLYVLLGIGVVRGNRAVWTLTVVLEGTVALVMLAASISPLAREDVALIALMLARAACLLAPGTRARMQGRVRTGQPT
jgi:hypothetical protein